MTPLDRTAVLNRSPSENASETCRATERLTRDPRRGRRAGTPPGPAQSMTGRITFFQRSDSRSDSTSNTGCSLSPAPAHSRSQPPLREPTIDLPKSIGFAGEEPNVDSDMTSVWHWFVDNVAETGQLHKKRKRSDLVLRTNDTAERQINGLERSCSDKDRSRTELESRNYCYCQTIAM